MLTLNLIFDRIAKFVRLRFNRILFYLDIYDTVITGQTLRWGAVKQSTMYRFIIHFLPNQTNNALNKLNDQKLACFQR